MKPFNVTLIRPDGYVHTLALLEAAEYVTACLTAGGHAAGLTTNVIDPDRHNIVFCAHLLERTHLQAVPADTIIFNSEQLRDKAGWHFGGFYRDYLERFYVWDYSLANLGEISHGRKDFIPFLFARELARVTHTPVPGAPLLFYGRITERRAQLIEDIKSAGVPVEIAFGLYGAERDAAMVRAWAVLNIRHTDALTTFEPIRCFYPLTNGVPVISESSASDPTFGLYEDWLVTFDKAALPQAVAALYRDKVGFSAIAAEKAAAFRTTSGVEPVLDAVAAYAKSLE